MIKFSAGKDAITSLVREGLLQTLSCILRSYPSPEIQQIILLFLKDVFQNVQFREFSISHDRIEDIQCICLILFNYLRQRIALKKTQQQQTKHNEHILAETATNILSIIFIKGLEGAQTVKFLETHGQSIILDLLFDPELQTPSCLLCFSILLRECTQQSNMEFEFSPKAALASDWNDVIAQNITVFSMDMWSKFLRSARFLLSSDNLNVSAKAIAVACISISIKAQDSEFNRNHPTSFNEEAVHETIVVIQNSLMDPMWKPSSRLLAVSCLEIILTSLPIEKAQCIASLEWFDFLVKQAFLSIDTAGLTSSADECAWIPWATLLYVLCPFLLLSGKDVIQTFFSEEKLDVLQKATLRNRMNFQGLRCLISIWISLLKLNVNIINVERAKELKSYFMTVFNDISCQTAHDATSQAISLSLQDSLSKKTELLQSRLDGSFSMEMSPDSTVCILFDALRFYKMGCVVEDETIPNKIVEIMRLLNDLQQVNSS